MKRIIAILLLVAIALTLCCCGKNKETEPTKSTAVKQAEKAIKEIGEVTLESEKAIKDAEKYYNILTDAEKAQVSNRLDLANAKEAFEALLAAEEENKKEQAFNNAKLAFEKLNEAAQLCIAGMDDVYGAWHFGIYDADDYSSSYVAMYLSLETSFTTNEITQACSDAGFSVSYLTYDFNYCLWAIEQAHINRGTFDQLHTLLGDVQSILQEMSEKYGDYAYYPKLKEYYAKVASYADFFENTTGSFQQLATTINDYENSIRTYQSDLNFIFA